MENVTEELVRQNGNQAAAVMADYVEQGGGGGGSTSGIPTIDKNTQPNIVWREPTEEDLAKFSTDNIGQVADLPNRQVPAYLIARRFGAGEESPWALSAVLGLRPPYEGDGSVSVEGNTFSLSEDWSLLGMAAG